MARKPKEKELQNARLLKEYASWIYCTACQKTVAYLCYVTYDLFEFEFACRCGSHGRVYIQFEHEAPTGSEQPLLLIKNRWCCPQDNAPLLTVVEKNIQNAQCRIVCHTCNTEFKHGVGLRDENVNSGTGACP